MRTTLTLDDDVAAKVKEEMHARGLSFKETVNLFLRRGLNTREPHRSVPFKVRTRDLGARPGVDFDKISELLDQLEGPYRR